MAMMVPVRWILIVMAGLVLAVLAYSGVYQLVVVTARGAPNEADSVIAYRLNRFTGSLAVCDTESCDTILPGWFGPSPPKSDRGAATPARAM
jgi:hypothetical protein